MVKRPVRYPAALTSLWSNFSAKAKRPFFCDIQKSVYRIQYRPRGGISRTQFFRALVKVSCWQRISKGQILSASYQQGFKKTSKWLKMTRLRRTSCHFMHCFISTNFVPNWRFVWIIADDYTSKGQESGFWQDCYVQLHAHWVTAEKWRSIGNVGRECGFAKAVDDDSLPINLQLTSGFVCSSPLRPIASVFRLAS